MDVINSSDNPPCGSTQCKVTLGMHVFNHFKDSFEQSCGSEKKEEADSQKVLIRNPFLAMLEFGFFWWFEYLWVPNKGAYPVPSEKPKGNHNLRNPLCFISRAFAGGRSFHSGAVAVIFAEAGDLFMTWICRFLCGSLLASKQHDLTYIWRSRGLSWAAWTVCGEISLICAVWDKVEAQKYIRGCR